MTRLRMILCLSVVLLSAQSLLGAPQAKGKGRTVTRAGKQVTITLVRWPYT